MAPRFSLRALGGVPLHTFFLAAYIPLALYAANAGEVASRSVVRPLLAAFSLAVLLLLLAFVLLRARKNAWQRSGLAATLTLVLFGAYGHLYNLLKATPALNPFARHRFLAPLFLLILLGGLALIVWKGRRPRALTSLLNVSAAFLLALPLLQSVSGGLLASSRAQQVVQSPLPVQPLKATPGALPSVYLIIMDTYMRSDSLQRDMGMDNSEFVSGLEQLGFYVPRCSRANYDYTQAALAAILNMDYQDQLQKELAEKGQEFNMTTLIKYSRVRQQLQDLGYQTIAFDSGYEWSRLYDADSYLALGKDSVAVQSLSQFELMLVKSTALRLATDYLIFDQQADFQLPSSQFNDHINLERFILATLPQLENQPGPKFVFTHLLIPHWPYVFLPDGSIRSDPAYATESLTDAQRMLGYNDSVRFLNSQLLPIVAKILANSATPPVIILVGDHGLSGDARFENFSAIYLPAGQRSELYPGISEVNLFRVAFNSVFQAGYPLLKDVSLRVNDEGESIVPETAVQCLP